MCLRSSANASMAEYETAKFELEKLKEQEEQMTADGAEPDYETWRKSRCEIARFGRKVQVFGQDALHAVGRQSRTLPTSSNCGPGFPQAAFRKVN